MAEYADLIGKPFAYCGRGPEEWDCYGLIRELLRRDGIEVPDYESPTDQAVIERIYRREIRLWRRIERHPHAWYVEPDAGVRDADARHYYVKGAILLFNIAGLGTHVGYVIGPNSFVHVWEGARLGVCIERIDDWAHRLVGSYRYVGE